MDCKICCICGEPKESKFCHKLECGHEFHYNCLFLTFKNMKTNSCPYCRKGHNLLPLVNGIKKIDYSIHDITNIDTFQNNKCKYIFKRGKRKGEECSKNCCLGEIYCMAHLKSIKN